jgi:hypothetical protein
MTSVDEQSEALRIAGYLIDHGVPVFAAPPCPGASCPRDGHQTGKHEYDLPPKWQLTVPSRVWLERWQPGWALAAVGGHVPDFLDEDPRYGGDESLNVLEAAGEMPRVFGVQETPSGGRHYVISKLGERETNAFMPGLDYQGGMDDGKGRAFIWIAPTVRKSKVEPYERKAYRWTQEPDLDYLLEFEGADDSIEGLRGRVLARKVKAEGNERRQDLPERSFTEAEAQKFCSITLDRLEQAEPGDIENMANNAACQLSHFVPEFWSEEFAYAVLSEALGQTKYDPNHPASGWTADKFHNVLAGVDGRAPADWVAVRKPETIEEAVPEADAVDSLLAEMLTPASVIKKDPPRPLIKGLLNLDSESWIIGAPGSKKSFVATDMAAHVAAGIPWQGRRVHQGPVVMIVAEGAGGLGPRLRAWELEHGHPMSEDIKILPRPIQSADLTAWATLIEACRRLNPALIVLDTQARITVGLEENSAKEMGVFIDAVRAAREATGACILTVHHTGRAGGDARGSSAIDGAQHTELKVMAEKGSLRGKLVSEKQKDMELAGDLELVFVKHDVAEDEDGDPITSLALVSDPFRKAEGQGQSEPKEDWEVHHPGVQAQIIKVMRDQGVGQGMTRAECRQSVADRWYEGTHGRDKGLRHSTYTTAWNTLASKEIISAVRGERYVLDEIALETSD